MKGGGKDGWMNRRKNPPSTVPDEADFNECAGECSADADTYERWIDPVAGWMGQASGWWPAVGCNQHFCGRTAPGSRMDDIRFVSLASMVH